MRTYENRVVFYYPSQSHVSRHVSIRVLKWFKSVSGLDINKEKTKVVKLGASRDSNIPWQGKFGFNSSNKFEILGIHFNMNKLNEITELNIQRKIGEIQQLIRIWSSRNLTSYGKVNIIKSLNLQDHSYVAVSSKPKLVLFQRPK